MMFPEIQQYLNRTISLITTFIVVILFFRFFVLDPGIVNGQSMEPSYQDEELFLINKFVYLVHLPQRYDVVQLFNSKTEDFIIKRIIGLPGEIVMIKHDGIYIQTVSGYIMHLPENYLPPDTYTTVQPGQRVTIVVPSDAYYVLGDNRQQSHDSRDFGPVHRRFIQGKVINF